ncbi:MAG: hypothetical protein QXX08_11340 [Candidatus Bathyarchaeia archaeon]
MSESKSKIIGVIINLSIGPVIKISRESGDLPVSKFSAITEFVNNIGEAINIGRIEGSCLRQPAFIFKNRSKIQLSAKSSV